MPIEMKYLDDGRGVIYIGEGIVTGEDIISANRQFFSSKEIMTKNVYGLIDYSDITKFEVSTSELETIASQNEKASEYLTDGMIAVVATNDLVFGISRMWEALVENTGLQWEIVVLRAKEDAEAWIQERVKEKFGIHDLTFG